MDRPRPSFDTIYMNFAVQISERSTCLRTNSKGDLMKVGCVIVSTDYRQVAVGFNGNAAGLPNHCDSTEVGACGCLHAELNAVINSGHIHRSTGKFVFATHLPCVACAKAIINVGATERKRNSIEKVIYLNDYRIRDSLELFKQVGIETAQFEPSMGLG